jgi:hypothetical protein
VYGDDKRRDMARSVLPANPGAARNARDRRALVHGANRAHQRMLLAGMAHDDSFDEWLPTGIDAQHGPDGGIKDVVRRRRRGDKLGPFIRWATAHANDLGPDPASRVAALEALLPDGLIGRHAMSHLTMEEAFAVGPNRRRRRETRTARRDRSEREWQSLEDRLRHRLAQRLDRLDELNRLIKAQWRPPADDLCARPRTLGGAHDIEAFVDDLIDTLTSRCSCGTRHGCPDHRQLDLVLEFCELPPV